MKRISILGWAAEFVLASAAALAQDLTAGKTAAQLFSSDCSACHRSPAGLAKNRDAGALAGFLREHYTTKPDTAGALAAYVSGFGGSAPADARTRPVTPAAAARNPAEAQRRWRGRGLRALKSEPEGSVAHH
jgi:mono/diheme cytochrome c family protein